MREVSSNTNPVDTITETHPTFQATEGGRAEPPSTTLRSSLPGDTPLERSQGIRVTPGNLSKEGKNGRRTNF